MKLNSDAGYDAICSPDEIAKLLRREHVEVMGMLKIIAYCGDAADLHILDQLKRRDHARDHISQSVESR